MATLINGNGNPRIYAAQDADLIAALAGDITGIAQIGNKFAATAVDANTISVADGAIVTKEGRRIQLDAGSTDMFAIPTGTTGVTNYYIIGYKLTTQSDDSQIAETFVQLMSSSSETIPEDTFRSGATDVYVSLYRVQQNGVNLGTITGLLPELTNISELNSKLSDKTITFNNSWYPVLFIQGQGIVMYFPKPVNSTSREVELTSIDIYDNGWVNGFTRGQVTTNPAGFTTVYLTAPSGYNQDVNNGKVMLGRLTGTITYH